MKVKNMKAKALDTLNFPVPVMVMQMSEVASSIVMQASAQALITHSMFIRTGGNLLKAQGTHRHGWSETLSEYQTSLMLCSERQSAIHYSKCHSSVNPVDNEGSRSIAAVIHCSPSHSVQCKGGSHPPEIMSQMRSQASPGIIAKQHLHPRSVLNVL